MALNHQDACANETNAAQLESQNTASKIEKLTAELTELSQQHQKTQAVISQLQPLVAATSTVVQTKHSADKATAGPSVKPESTPYDQAVTAYEDASRALAEKQQILGKVQHNIRELDEEIGALLLQCD